MSARRNELDLLIQPFNAKCDTISFSAYFEKFLYTIKSPMDRSSSEEVDAARRLLDLKSQIEFRHAQATKLSVLCRSQPHHASLDMFWVHMYVRQIHNDDGFETYELRLYMLPYPNLKEYKILQDVEEALISTSHPVPSQ